MKAAVARLPAIVIERFPWPKTSASNSSALLEEHDGRAREQRYASRYLGSILEELSFERRRSRYHAKSGFALDSSELVNSLDSYPIPTWSQAHPKFILDRNF